MYFNPSHDLTILCHTASCGCSKGKLTPKGPYQCVSHVFTTHQVNTEALTTHASRRQVGEIASCTLNRIN